MQRRLLNRPAQISFTSDYHELLEGDLRPGRPFNLRYDPHRMMPPPAYIFGDPSWPVTAMLRFVEDGLVRQVPLRGDLTRLPDRDPTGQGSMLSAIVDIPTNARFVEAWFRGDFPDGTHWDSDYGGNFWFRFPYADIISISAAVTPTGGGVGRFTIAIETCSDVSRVAVRFYDLSAPVHLKREEALRRAGATDAQYYWEYDDTVAATAVVRFKLYYWITDRRYKDDNSGEYYVAERPDSTEVVPLPPDALLAAARQWQQRTTS